MINAIQIALTGLARASNAVDVSARNIAQTGTASAPAALLAGEEQDAGTPPVPAGNESLIGGTTEPDLVTDIVNMKQASTAYKANLGVIRTADAMQDELLSIFDRKI